MTVFGFLDPHLLAFPGGSVLESDIISYIDSLIPWQGIDKVDGVSVYAIRNLIERLQEDGHYPLRDRIKSVIDRFQIEYIQPQDVMLLWHGIASRFIPIEDYTGIDDVEFKDFTSSPKIEHDERSDLYVDILYKTIVLSNMPANIPSPPFTNVLITRGVHPPGPITVSVNIVSILENGSRIAYPSCPMSISGAILVADRADHLRKIKIEQMGEPGTVNEAALFAARLYSQYLHIGGDVPGGISRLDPGAGPPTKILHQLSLLHDYAELINTTSDPGDVQRWLRERGVDVSSESPADERNSYFRNARTWDDGAGNSYFSLHSRPSNHTSFNRCVRIYFKIDRKNKKALVGWIGPKPA